LREFETRCLVPVHCTAAGGAAVTRLNVLDRVVCVRCRGPLDPRAADMRCTQCGQAYPRLGRIAVLLPRPEDQIVHWRQQLAALIAQEQKAHASVEQEASQSGILPDGITRLRVLADGVRLQALEVLELIGPALKGPAPPAPTTVLPPGLKHIHYLYRDWAWEEAGNDENARALHAIRSIMTEQPLGDTLVLGAGACRLAYDLHRTCGAIETCVVDLDPFLFLIAEAVVSGGSVQLTEATPTIGQASHAAKRWTLRTPHAALSSQRFHFFLSDGLAPPFSADSFDTVVTPWFIDQVPPDLPAFVATMHEVLRTGGRWINQGPLLYPVNHPLSLRYSREEIFDLLQRAGFQLGKWSYESQAYLVSPLSGRGKVEAVLTFEATKGTA